MSEVIWDIPALLGKSIDEVKAMLGEPAFDDEGPVRGQRDTEEWKSWEAPNAKKALHVVFDRITRQVTKFELQYHGMDIENMPTDPLEYLRAGNMNPNDPRYTINVRESGHPETGQPRGCFAAADLIPK